ncbi:alkyl hydroperoxide reductase subunit F [Aurantiacibacter spongiae]|uniref:Thioredoxin reductase n=1 Tax=Aurantiacibacter spongiae TaxID=2488860 RepID=A0A3N5CWD6_9SPHN|nr:alkyl hydroperoxide reductase subunit F [Aurantiacibacter spongiae]RPF71850.1 alkyl hydroperoxide reductase subunit F [Aurantiacibacter spongiae]
MLDKAMTDQLKTYLGNLREPVELVASLGDDQKSAQTRELLEEIAALHPDVSASFDGDAERRPSFVIRRASDPARWVRFAGLPMGHEFTSLVLALLWAGGHPPRVDAEIIEQIERLEGDFAFEMYFSLSCHNCPDVVQALTLMALVNPRITATLIEGGTYQDEVEARNVMAVPATFLNGEPFYNGKMSLEEVLARVDTGAGRRAAEKLAAKKPFEVLVIGGGPAGVAASVYTARKGIRTGIAAERFGGQLNDTLGIENLPGTEYTEGPKLVADLERQVAAHDAIDAMNLAQASRLVPAREAGDWHEVHMENGAVLKARSLILSTGARWRALGVPGEQELRNKGVAYCPHCDGPLFKGKRVAVIGGGNSGVEAAIDLAGIVGHVTLIEYDGQLRADEVLQKKLRSLSNVDILTSAQTTRIAGKDKVSGLTWKHRESGQEHDLELEGVFVQIGLVPNTEWLKDSGIALSRHGEIEVDARGGTSVPGVFAAGDCTTTPYKQIVVAMGEGSKAALSAFDYLIRNESAGKVAQAA